MVLTHLLFKDPSRHDLPRGKESVAGCSKNIALQEVQFSTTCQPTLLGTVRRGGRW